MKRAAILIVVGAAVGLVLFLSPRSIQKQSASSTNNSAKPASQTPPRTRTDSEALNHQSAAVATNARAVLSSSIESSTNAVAAFSDWAERFLAGDVSASISRGEALAWKRRDAMLELIESDPEKALSLAVPFEWRVALPQNITRHFEQWVDARGDLTVAVATDFERGGAKVYREATVDGKSFKAFVFGRRNNQVSQTRIPLHGITLGGKMAVSADAIRILSLNEAAALEKERGQSADVICGVSNFAQSGGR